MKNRHRYRRKLISYLQWLGQRSKISGRFFFISKDIFIVPSKSGFNKEKKEITEKQMLRKRLISNVFRWWRGHFECLLIKGLSRYSKKKMSNQEEQK